MKENEKSMRADHPLKADQRIAAQPGEAQRIAAQQQGNQAEGEKEGKKIGPIQEEIKKLKQQKRQVSRELNQVENKNRHGRKTSLN